MSAGDAVAEDHDYGASPSPAETTSARRRRELDELIRQKYERGEAIAKIMGDCGIARDTVYNALERQHVPLRGRRAAASADDLETRLWAIIDRRGERPVPSGIESALARICGELDRLRALLNAPEILDFVKAVQLEAAHQRQRWPSEHDAGKTDADWFWLIGYLAGKALHNPPKQGAKLRELQLHRIVTVAAAACNWHAARLGKTNMRPGIAPPAGEDAA